MSAELAQWAEGNHPGWAVVWGEYHRTFTAWAMWSSEPLKVEASDTAALTVAVRVAEQERLIGGRNPAGTWKTQPQSGGASPPERHGPGVERARRGPHPSPGVRGGRFLRGRDIQPERAGIRPARKESTR